MYDADELNITSNILIYSFQFSGNFIFNYKVGGANRFSPGIDECLDHYTELQYID